MESVLILAIDSDQPRVQEVLLLTGQHVDTSVTCLRLTGSPIIRCVATELCLDSVSSNTRLSTGRLSCEGYTLVTLLLDISGVHN